jgi:hypothetical protein
MRSVPARPIAARPSTGLVHLVLPGPAAAFKGNTQLKAGHLPQAKETLLGALADPSIAGNRGEA